MNSYKPIPQLTVLADPFQAELAKRRGAELHTLHQHRFIATEDCALILDHVDGVEPDEAMVHVYAGSVVATMTDCEDQAALARLFAAAPDLLEALESTLPMLIHFDETEGCPITLRRVKAAIAKARGT